jgi:5-methylcytosine-specific restriction endonuclease McrA
MSSSNQKKVMCQKCGTWCGSGRKYCPDCRKTYKEDNGRRNLEKLKDITKADCVYKHGEMSNKYAYIRWHAKNKFKNVFTECKICGYDKHVELCHIKSIKSFPDDALLEDMNSEKNIVPLCPNCHWEFDHGILKLKN